MPTPIVDLSAITSLAEIVVRGGDASDPRARRVLQQGYQQPINFPDVQGLSVVFRAGASLDELARVAAYPNAKLSYSVISRMQAELRVVGYDLVLYVTPSRRLPDHHTLAIAAGGVPLPSLPDAAADALIRSLIVVDNPYRGP